MKHKLLKKILCCLLALTMLFSCFSASALSAAAGDFDTPIVPINPGHTHTYVPTVTLAATCTEEGVTSYRCSCGKVSRTEPISALGHSLSFTEGNEASCTQAGNKPYYACKRCGNYFADDKGESLIADKNEVVLAATGHRFDVFEPYCLNLCGEENPNYNPQHVHHFEATVTPPTCTEQGYTTHLCACGESYRDSFTETLEHTPAAAVRENEKAATCTTAGSFDEVVYCAVCRAELSRNTKPTDLLSHTPAAAVRENEKAATCTTAGSFDEVVYCAVCRAELSRNTKSTDLLSHTPAAAVRENEKASTCTTAGSFDEVVRCASCSAELSRKTVSIPTLAHNYKDTKVVKPTAVKAGYTDQKCSVCGVKKRVCTAPTGKVTGLKCKARTAAAETMTWAAVKGAQSYQIQISTKDGKAWDKTYNAKTATSYTMKSLTAGGTYKFRVRIYAKGVDGKYYYGAWTKAVTSPTLPSGTSLTKATGASKSFSAQWKQNKNVNGYQVQYSLKSNFSGAKTVTIKSNKTLKTTVKKLSAKKVYYVRIRTYKTMSSANYFSAWSKSVKVKTK